MFHLPCRYPCIIGLFVFFCCLQGCKQNQTKLHLSPVKFADIYTLAVTQLMNIQQSDRLTQSQKDSIKIVLFNDSTRIDTLLRLNGVNRDLYEQTINYYDEHPELWLKVFTTVETKLEKLEKDDKEKTISSQKPSPPQK